MRRCGEEGDRSRLKSQESVHSLQVRLSVFVARGMLSKSLFIGALKSNATTNVPAGVVCGAASYVVGKLAPTYTQNDIHKSPT